MGFQIILSLRTHWPVEAQNSFCVFYISLKHLSPSHAFAVDDRKRGEKIEHLECVRTIEVVSFPDLLAFEYVLCRH